MAAGRDSLEVAALRAGGVDTTVFGASVVDGADGAHIVLRAAGLSGVAIRPAFAALGGGGGGV